MIGCVWGGPAGAYPAYVWMMWRSQFEMRVRKALRAMLVGKTLCVPTMSNGGDVFRTPKIQTYCAQA